MPLTSQELQSKLWQAADILRGQIDSADYKNYIFSILFLKRLSDRFDEEVEGAVSTRGVPLVTALTDPRRARVLCSGGRPLVRHHRQGHGPG